MKLEVNFASSSLDETGSRALILYFACSRGSHQWNFGGWKTYCKDAKSCRLPKKRCDGLLFYLFILAGRASVVDRQKNSALSGHEVEPDFQPVTRSKATPVSWRCSARSLAAVRRRALFQLQPHGCFLLATVWNWPLRQSLNVFNEWV